MFVAYNRYRINKNEMKKLLAIGVGAIVAGVLGVAILLPVHVHVETSRGQTGEAGARACATDRQREGN